MESIHNFYNYFLYLNIPWPKRRVVRRGWNHENKSSLVNHKSVDGGRVASRFLRSQSRACASCSNPGARRTNAGHASAGTHTSGTGAHSSVH